MKKASSDRRSGRPSGASARRGRREGRRFPALARSGPCLGAAQVPLTNGRAVSIVPSRSVSIPARQGSGSLPGSKRNVVLYPLSHAPDLLDQVGQVAAVLDEVDVRAVDHEKRGLCVMVKEVPKRLREPAQVLQRDATLVVPVALPEATQEHLRSGLEVDDEVRPRELPVEKLVDLLVQTELIGIEVELREDDVPREQVVGDGPLREEIELPERALLAVALEQEEELSLERIFPRILVEPSEKRILLSLLEEELRPELRGESPCKGRLADADRPLHGDVPPRRPLDRHPLPRHRDAYHPALPVSTQTPEQPRGSGRSARPPV